MPSISAEERNKSVNFMNAINGLLNFVETIAPLIQENDYLEQMDNLKAVYDNRNITQIVEMLTQRVRNDPVVRQNDTRSRLSIKQKNALTDQEKLKSGKWLVCVRCDRIICKNYIETHINNNVCVRIKDSKALTKDFKKLDTTRETKLISAIRSWAVKTHRYKCC